MDDIFKEMFSMIVAKNDWHTFWYLLKEERNENKCKGG